MTDSTKTVVTSASSKQALPYGLGPLEQIQQKQKSFLRPPIHTTQFCVHVTFGEEISVSPRALP